MKTPSWKQLWEAGAEDVVTYDDGAIDVYTAWEEMGKVRDALEAAGLKAEQRGSFRDPVHQS